MKERKIKNSSELILADSTLMILIALEREELHRYGIKTYIEELTDGQFIIPNSTLYSSVNKFVRLGLVEQVNPDYTKSRFRLTKDGRRLLADKTDDVIKTLELLKKYRVKDKTIEKIDLKKLTKGGLEYDMTASIKEDEWFLDLIMSSLEITKIFTGVAFSLERKIKFSTVGNNMGELWQIIETSLKNIYGHRNVSEIYLHGISKLFDDMEKNDTDVVLKSGRGAGLGTMFSKLSALFLNFTLNKVMLSKPKVDKNIEEINKITENIEKYIEKHTK